MTGTVHLVGAGPGNPDLLTVKALRVLQSADVVLHDRLVGAGVLDLIPDRVEKIDVGKTPGTRHDTQGTILDLMVLHARRGRTVVRLKGGDPFVFGRGGEEWEHLARHEIPVEVVPGISSALAVPVLAGIPLTYRGVASSFAVVAGHLSGGHSDRWAKYAHIDTLVVLMGVTHRQGIASALIRIGRAPEQPAAFIERGTTPEERITITTLEAIRSGNTAVKPPAVLVVGDVVTMCTRQLAANTTNGSYPAADPHPPLVG